MGGSSPTDTFPEREPIVVCVLTHPRMGMIQSHLYLHAVGTLLGEDSRPVWFGTRVHGNQVRGGEFQKDPVHLGTQLRTVSGRGTGWDGEENAAEIHKLTEIFFFLND